MSGNGTEHIFTESTDSLRPKLADRSTSPSLHTDYVSESRVTTPTSTMTIPSSNPISVNNFTEDRPGMTVLDSDDVTAVNLTDRYNRKVDVVHVWALWGVVIAVGLLVIIVLIVLSKRCCVNSKCRRSSPKGAKKPGKGIPNFRKRTPKLPPRTSGVMADHKDVRQGFFHSLERGDVQARRQEATRRWLQGEFSSSVQYMDGSGSGSHTDCIPMYETSCRRGGLDRIPENQEFSFTHPPRGPRKLRLERPIVHHYTQDNINEFVRVIPLNAVRDQNGNIAISPPTASLQQHHSRPRWNSVSRTNTFSRVFPHGVRAVSSEPPRYRISRQPVYGRRPLGGRGTRTAGMGNTAGEAGVRSGTSCRWKPPKTTLPKFNLAGEVIMTSSEASQNGATRGCDFSPKWDDWSYDNTVFEVWQIRIHSNVFYHNLVS